VNCWPTDSSLVRRFLAGHRFTLTGAQRRVLNEIARDMTGALPMHRLLQGDVGSGKTVVALTAMLAARDGGRQRC
jgi:ATP-dependent DNA helicase RecG